MRRSVTRSGDSPRRHGSWCFCCRPWDSRAGFARRRPPCRRPPNDPLSVFRSPLSTHSPLSTLHSPMLLGYNTNGMAHHDLLDAVTLLSELGYRSVAITIDHGALPPNEA